MFGSETAVICWGACAAASWGAGDFSGGLASKKGSVLSVLVVSQAAGGLILLALALGCGQKFPGPGDMLIGGLAGLCGALGIICLYSGLARGRMGVVAPLSAVTAAMVPILFSIATSGFPGPLKLIGFGGGLISIWLLSRGPASSRPGFAEMLNSLAAGTGFGLFFILVDQIRGQSYFWPLFAARLASVAFLSCLILGKGGFKSGRGTQAWFLTILAGILDTAGNVFFFLATRAGRLDAAVMSTSLYPAVTVILAFVLLKERLGPSQWIGVVSAMLALGLIAS